MNIRPERPDDAPFIAGVVERAFATEEHSSRTEQFIVRELRRAGALSVSLVAVEAETIVGHVAFSPVTISDGTLQWYGLGPVAVEPSRQSQGIGTAFIRAGIEKLIALNAAGCVVLGDPAYYGRFGFKGVQSLEYPGPPSEYFMARLFKGAMPQGVVAYHAAFDATA